MPKSVTINTVQGIGDIFWVYQKLAPHVDVLNLNILCPWRPSALQERSRDFCAMLPKVGAFRYVRTDLAYYNRVASARLAIASVLGSAGVVDYAVNGPLEQGVGLREIDPDYGIEEFVDLGLPESVERGDFLCAFVAGEQNSRCWTEQRWVDAIGKIADRIGTKRIALVGAEWDKVVQDGIGKKLVGLGYAVANHVGALSIDASIDVIRRARFFVGYQSGLNVLADNYDVPQLMVYYPILQPMMFTWCKRENMNGNFRAMTFDRDVDEHLAPIESLVFERQAA
jgi:hypothetical protein